MKFLKNKNGKIIIITATIIIILICVLLITNTTTSIVGEWTVINYIFDQEKVYPNEIAEYMGDIFANWNKSSFTFTPNGHVIVKMPTDNVGTLSENSYRYVVEGKYVEIFDSSDEDDYTLLEIDNNTLIFPLYDYLDIIFAK